MLYPQDTDCDCLARIGIVVNYMFECVLVKFIIEHNYQLSVTSSKSRMHHSHSTIHKRNVVLQPFHSLNSEGIGPFNIARLCNTADG